MMYRHYTCGARLCVEVRRLVSTGEDGLETGISETLLHPNRRAAWDSPVCISSKDHFVILKASSSVFSLNLGRLRG
jgi:hypothetical protein